MAAWREAIWGVEPKAAAAQGVMAVSGRKRAALTGADPMNDFYADLSSTELAELTNLYHASSLVPSKHQAYYREKYEECFESLWRRHALKVAKQLLQRDQFTHLRVTYGYDKALADLKEFLCDILPKFSAAKVKNAEAGFESWWQRSAYRELIKISKKDQRQMPPEVVDASGPDPEDPDDDGGSRIEEVGDTSMGYAEAICSREGPLIVAFREFRMGWPNQAKTWQAQLNRHRDVRIFMRYFGIELPQASQSEIAQLEGVSQPTASRAVVRVTAAFADYLLRIGHGGK